MSDIPVVRSLFQLDGKVALVTGGMPSKHSSYRMGNLYADMRQDREGLGSILLRRFCKLVPPK